MNEQERIDSVAVIVLSVLDIFISQELLTGDKVLSSEGQELRSSINLEDFNITKEEVFCTCRAIGIHYNITKENVDFISNLVWIKLQIL